MHTLPPTWTQPPYHPTDRHPSHTLPTRRKAGLTNFQHSLQYRPGLNPIICWMSLLNLSTPVSTWGKCVTGIPEMQDWVLPLKPFHELLSECRGRWQKIDTLECRNPGRHFDNGKQGSQQTLGQSHLACVIVIILQDRSQSSEKGGPD